MILFIVSTPAADMADCGSQCRKQDFLPRKRGFYHPAGMPHDKEYVNSYDALKQGSYRV